MKKLILFFAVVGLVIVACQDNTDEVNPTQEITAIDMSDFYVYTDDDDLSAKASTDAKVERCHTMKVLNRQLRENPGLYQKMYVIEKHTRQVISSKKPPGTPGGGPKPKPEPGPTPYDGDVSIPVMINIIEKYAGQVTLDQITTQIAILNEDFNNNNPFTDGEPGYEPVPEEFEFLVADVNITFTWKNKDIVRKTDTRSSWGTNDAMKYSSQGGIDASDASTYLNIWVCEIGGNILGYAQFPGGSSATDGVVIGTNYFGETSSTNYGDGRTATHEVGHWLNLRHIWGDGRCRRDDFVSDTPSSDRPNYGCPDYPTVHCRSNDMTMNYMDYVYDNCMYMFTPGQDDRMRALFASGGAKESFVPSTSP